MRIRKTLRILGITLMIVAIALVIVLTRTWFRWTKILAPRYRSEAEQRWTDIGRPMAKFEGQLRIIDENDSFRALSRDLQPFGIKSLYKAREGEAHRLDSITIPRQITNVVDSSNLPTTDEVDLAKQDFSYLDEHKVDLDRLYDGVLQRPPAVWNLVLSDGLTLRVPSYLAARYMSQLIFVDALRKLQRGDQAAADRAVAAGLKFTSNIGEQPIVVSQMIRVAIEGLFAPIIARLPEDPDALRRFPADVDERREMWRAAIQAETWSVKQACDYGGMNPNEFRKTYEKSSFLQKAQSSLCLSLLQVNCSLFMMAAADHVCASERVMCLSASDLGVGKMSDACHRYAPVLPEGVTWMADAFRPNWSRSWIRLNAMLLLREQAELIRSARTQVQLGKSGIITEFESVVIHDAKWEITGDAETNSVSLKLTPIPDWVANAAVPKNFFLLPLEGSKFWKYRRQPPELISALRRESASAKTANEMANCR